MGGFARPLRVVGSPEEADTLLLVDVANLAFRSQFAYADLTTSKGEFSGHVYGALTLLLSTLRNQLKAPARVCIVFAYEGPKSRAKRAAILPEYKAHRDTVDRKNPCPDVREVFSFLPGVHLCLPEKEGDDAIAWAAETWHHTHHLVVLSGDKDLWALMRFPNVAVFSPNLKAFVTPERIEEQFGTSDPAKVYLAKSLYGDSSDGIKGIPRLPRANTNLVINGMVGHDPASFYEHQVLGSFTKNTLQKLADGRQVVERNFQVVIPDTDGVLPDDVVLTKDSPERRQGFVALLDRYECRSLIDQAHLFFGGSIW